MPKTLHSLIAQTHDCLPSGARRVNMQPKICENCGRKMEYRKAWAKNWDQVKYCSDRCRKQKNAPDYRAHILQLLSQRAAGATICPSEVLSESEKQNALLMERVRMSARKLVAEGRIEIVQRGRVVDPSEFRGPIRLRLKRK